MAKPFPELADPPADYELSVWLRFHYDDYQEIADGVDRGTVVGDYVLECGRESGRWRLRVLPKIGEDDDGWDVKEPPVLDLRGQATGADPLALLRALLSGGSA